ncbi:MAG: hypothetical protein J7M25_16235 [Deltaproteobacteria bacterium]|nr:hypothetical protein [Deltaproteobacteria bacterium]
MSSDLEQAMKQIDALLKKEGFVVFRGDILETNPGAVVLWSSGELIDEPGDTRMEDVQGFLAAARAFGVKVIVKETDRVDDSLLEALDFFHDEVDLDEWIEGELSHAELGALADRIHALGEHEEGELVSLALSFVQDGVLYQYVLQEEWYEDIHDLIDVFLGEEEDEEGDE